MFLRTQYYYCYYFGWNYLDRRRVCALTLVDLFSYDQNMESEYCFKGLAVSASSLNVILDRLKNRVLVHYNVTVFTLPLPIKRQFEWLSWNSH